MTFGEFGTEVPSPSMVLLYLKNGADAGTLSDVNADAPGAYGWCKCLWMLKIPM